MFNQYSVPGIDIFVIQNYNHFKEYHWNWVNLSVLGFYLEKSWTNVWFFILKKKWNTEHVKHVLDYRSILACV